MVSQLDEDDKVCHFLLTMTEKCNRVITVLETMEGNITANIVKTKLLNAKIKINTESECVVYDETAFSTHWTFQSRMSPEKPNCFPV